MRNKIKRRTLLQSSVLLGAAPWLTGLQAGEATGEHAQKEAATKTTVKQIRYLEIVTPDVDGAVALHSELHGITFSEPDENLGGARTAKLGNGPTLAIRGPLRDTETPVVRSYYLVTDIEAAVALAARAGAEIAMAPTDIPRYCRFSVLIQGGIEFGFWQEL